MVTFINADRRQKTLKIQQFSSIDSHLFGAQGSRVDFDEFMTTRYRHGIVHDVSRVALLLRLLAVTALVALAPAAASAQVLFADLNGDGIHDRVDAGLRPTDIVVRLSTSQRRQLHADFPIIRFAAVDFNRDGQLDLVATTSDDGGLAVWINRGNGRFAQRFAGRHASRLFGDRGRAQVARHYRPSRPNDNGDDVSGRPMPAAAATRVVHEFSYVRHVRDTRVVHVRFHTRSVVPRGPPATQLF
ncbi:MAG TPA: VCBS repeat-containing protein [Vicinamibacterales bacterium]|nr:VCBS repeat-containing protein [Vicinamibacterales bacterium]